MSPAKERASSQPETSPRAREFSARNPSSSFPTWFWSIRSTKPKTCWRLSAKITITYLGIDRPRDTRREILKARFGFNCSCRLCSLPADLSLESDKRLIEIQRLDRLINQHGVMGILTAPLKVLRFVDQKVCLYTAQSPHDAGLSRAFWDAAQIAIANGDLARGKVFAEAQSLGGRSAREMTARMLPCLQLWHGNPASLSLYGMSSKWKTTLDEIPKALSPADFEDWLWKREKPRAQEQQPSSLPGKLASLRNRDIFPAFADLPGEHEIDLNFYDSTDGATYHPASLMQVKDVDGETLSFFFYTDGRGGEVDRAQLQNGYTVAVLYAKVHDFLYGDPSIHVEEAFVVRIFPISLQGCSP
ncbi:hypothetical protein B0H63DRAFT_515714 [Podospora didyma]|uniref:SET domain-containing protein n=1 Tax=Podospora didyma TaxID=330526 RepID=A0AAE0N234_9PEZI|nr:hypothetical protein B0H63DRAFT_515714 [Podospora didyma]